MNIANDHVVTIHYSLTDETGELLDSSKDSGPLSYLHGANNIIPGLEKELTGKAKGDELKVTVMPEDAYGDMDDDLVQEIPREMFDTEMEIQPGMAFQAQGEVPHMVVVVDVNDETVTVDANHPLAGKVLTFEVTVEGVREANQEELDHGHVH